jgi:UDPglucose 6-dehydrogenase
MNVAIIGCGFVGNAVANGLKKNTKLLKIDPKLQNSIEDLKLFSPDIIFICVPTPMSSDNEQDLTILDNVINELDCMGLTSQIVIKSTVLPNYIEAYRSKFNELVYNPEFLTEKNADNDFINADLILLGGKNSGCDDVEIFYNKYTKCVQKNCLKTDFVTASLIKYSINSFLATKVIFFNELYKVFKKSNSTESWENIVNIISCDKRIGSSHMSVPGHDGRYGFGGACFPKDTKALASFAKSLGIELNLLNTVISINNIIRSEYNSLTPRESAQNITFEQGET